MEKQLEQTIIKNQSNGNEIQTYKKQEEILSKKLKKRFNYLKKLQDLLKEKNNELKIVRENNSIVAKKKKDRTEVKLRI